MTGYASGAANIILPWMGSKMAELLLSIYPVKGNNFEGESMYKLLSKYKKKLVRQYFDCTLCNNECI